MRICLIARCALAESMAIPVRKSELLFVLSWLLCACRTAEFSAPGVKMPVLVGPVQPPVASCVALRTTAISAATKYVISSEGGNSRYDSASTTITEVTVDAVVKDIEVGTGTCNGCWLRWEELVGRELQSLYLGFASVTMEGRGKVVHILSGDPFAEDACEP